MDTAVEWLVEQMLVCNYINKKQYDNCKTWLLQEAKEMEKQQIIDAHINGQSEYGEGAYRKEVEDNSEYYYNETFKK